MEEILYHFICKNCGSTDGPASYNPNSKLDYNNKNVFCRYCGLPMLSSEKSDEEYEVLYEKMYGVSIDTGNSRETRRLLLTFISNQYIQEHSDTMDMAAVERMRAARSENDRRVEAEIQARQKAPRCPNCKMPTIHPQQKGFSIGKAAAGALVAGPVGVVAGMHGASDEVYKCDNCGKKFKFKDAFYFG